MLAAVRPAGHLCRCICMARCPQPLRWRMHGKLTNRHGLLPELPPALVAWASTPTPGGFCMDIAGGPAWETFVGVEFAEHLDQRYELNGTRAAFGFSRGGYGALKLAFRGPDSYAAVAALCPVIFPAETSAAVPEKISIAPWEKMRTTTGAIRFVVWRAPIETCYAVAGRASILIAALQTNSTCTTALSICTHC